MGDCVKWNRGGHKDKNSLGSPELRWRTLILWVHLTHGLCLYWMKNMEPLVWTRSSQHDFKIVTILYKQMYDLVLMCTTVSKIHFPSCFTAHLTVTYNRKLKTLVLGSFYFKLLPTSIHRAVNDLKTPKTHNVPHWTHPVVCKHTKEVFNPKPWEISFHPKAVMVGGNLLYSQWPMRWIYSHVWQ